MRRNRYSISNNRNIDSIRRRLILLPVNNSTTYRRRRSSNRSINGSHTPRRQMISRHTLVSRNQNTRTNRCSNNSRASSRTSRAPVQTCQLVSPLTSHRRRTRTRRRRYKNRDTQRRYRRLFGRSHPFSIRLELPSLEKTIHRTS